MNYYKDNSFIPTAVDIFEVLEIQVKFVKYFHHIHNKRKLILELEE